MLASLASGDRRFNFRRADFSSLAEALDYAAKSRSGLEFYSQRGVLTSVLPYAALREAAIVTARRLRRLGLRRGARVALAAETSPSFVTAFFGCQYAGVVPVPFPALVRAGQEAAFEMQLKRLLQNSSATVVLTGSGFARTAAEALTGMDICFNGSYTELEQIPESTEPLKPLLQGDLALIQYTSGSTRFPVGVMLGQEAVIENVRAMATHGLNVRAGDRGYSWLPFHHDMGLIGALLVSVASQMTTGLMASTAFAMRPGLWPRLMAETGATISFGPPFAYELCARRVSHEEANGLDLSAWRVAGVGADRIREEVLEAFAQRFAVSGFDRRAFLPCYGLAECSLAVSFGALGEGYAVDRVDRISLANEGRALPSLSSAARSFVSCGAPLPGLAVEIRDESGRILGERRVGSIHVRGHSTMLGYLSDAMATSRIFQADGWLDTGDLGYLLGNCLVVTGRKKDLIVVNGRNIWPQDIEDLAVEAAGLLPGDVVAFAGATADGTEKPILWIRRQHAKGHQATLELANRIGGLLRATTGVECHVELVDRLPKTTSGKVSRTKASKAFRTNWGPDSW